MSLKIIKSGLNDTVQDKGRYGYQHLGINPNGVMDPFSAALANALLGKEEHTATIEMHFPAASILFEEATIICITGGHFSPEINNVLLPLNQPVVIHKNSTLKFKKWISGARCYLAIFGELDIKEWLNSCSTNLKANAGGLYGRKLVAGDVIYFKRKIEHFLLHGNKAFDVLPWKAAVGKKETNEIHFLKGAEWDWLTEDSKTAFTATTFTITKNSDRMGYRLAGESLSMAISEQVVSTGVTFGTVQALPNGQLILLMADHQTTGGYPKVAHVISAHLPRLAQMQPGHVFRFTETHLQNAEKELIEQKKYLHQLRNTCRFKIEKVINAEM